jgi:hypothetical protein
LQREHLNLRLFTELSLLIEPAAAVASRQFEHLIELRQETSRFSAIAVFPFSWSKRERDAVATEMVDLAWSADLFAVIIVSLSLSGDLLARIYCGRGGMAEGEGSAATTVVVAGRTVDIVGTIRSVGGDVVDGWADGADEMGGITSLGKVSAIIGRLFRSVVVFAGLCVHGMAERQAGRKTEGWIAGRGWIRRGP